MWTKKKKASFTPGTTAFAHDACGSQSWYCKEGGERLGRMDSWEVKAGRREQNCGFAHMKPKEKDTTSCVCNEHSSLHRYYYMRLNPHHWSYIFTQHYQLSD